MPEIPVGSQIFDLAFHPTSAIAYTGLLTGHVKAFAYDEQGNGHNLWSLRPSKKSCRGLSITQDGSKLFAVGKSKALQIIDTSTNDIDVRSAAHDCAINRVKCLTPWTVATGDDDGTVKLWDSRKADSVKTYTQHFDYISDFLWLDDKKQLIAASGDGTLSVIDIRAKEPKPLAQSEDQEDDLLSIVAIKNNQKVLVGTQLGIVSVFNRKKGWADCVDRIPGHPLSIDTLSNIPDDIPGTDPTSTVLTGSSDGFIRVVQILPTKFVGVVADHGEFPVERIAIGSGASLLGQSKDESESKPREAHASPADHEDDDGEAKEEEHRMRPGRWWLGSVGHDETLRMTDLGAFFHEITDESEEGEEDDGEGEDEGDEWYGIQEQGNAADSTVTDDESGGGRNSAALLRSEIPAGLESESEDKPEAVLVNNQRKRKQESDVVEGKRPKKGKKENLIDKAFFDEL